MTPFFFPVLPSGTESPSATLPDVRVKRVGQNAMTQRVSTARARKPLAQPPHYGRVGAQPLTDKPCPIETAATTAVRAANFDRAAVTLKHGSKATVR